MSDSLSIYLEDHLAGAAYAIDLVEYMRDQHKGEELGQFAAELLIDINADQKILQQLADRAGAGSSALKEVTAWLGEKITRLKLRHEAGDSLGVFEALEFLSLGIRGKLALWSALRVAAMADARLHGVDFEQLAARAEQQHATVETRRLEFAHTVFGTEAAGKSRQNRDVRSPDARRAQERKTRGGTVVGFVVLAAAAVVAISLAPDVVRYMKIRAM
jgi:hypothetical protein